MNEKLAELEALEESGKLPKILKEIPLDDDVIFFKKEAKFVITTKGVKILSLIVIVSILIFLSFTYVYFILHTYETEAYLKVATLYFLLIVFMTLHIFKRVKSPQVAEIYDTGIWLQDYKIYIPFERIYSTELVYPSQRKAIRSPFIYVFMSALEKKKHLKSFSLKVLNLNNSNKNLLKLDLGTSEAFMKQDAQGMIDNIYYLAAEHNERLGVTPPYYFVEDKPSYLKRLLTFLPFS